MSKSKKERLELLESELLALSIKSFNNQFRDVNGKESLWGKTWIATWIVKRVKDDPLFQGGPLFNNDQEYRTWKKGICAKKNQEVFAQLRSEFLAYPMEKFNTLFNHDLKMSQKNLSSTLKAEAIQVTDFGTRQNYEAWQKEILETKTKRELAKLKAEFLKLPLEDFNKLFEKNNKEMKQNTITINNITIGEDLYKKGAHPGLFKSQEDYHAWKKELIATKNKNRVHLFKANLKEFKDLKATYQELKGDHLKSVILAGFQNKILQTESEAELNELVKTFEESNEYKILAKNQGLTALLPIKTSSVRAFKKTVEEHRETLLNSQVKFEIK